MIDDTTHTTHTTPLDEAEPTEALTYAVLPAAPAIGVGLTCVDPQCVEAETLYSARRGDYGDRGDEPVTCAACGAPMALVRRVLRLVPVTVGEASA